MMKGVCMARYEFTDDELIELKEDVDYEQLFDYLYIPYRRKGTRYIEFLCPLHNDRNFGSAKVDLLKNKKCVCYACSKVFSPLDLIMECENKNLHEAAVILADLEGVLWRYEKEPSKKKDINKNKTVRLNSQQKILLGLNTTRKSDNIIGFDYHSLPNSVYDVDADGFVLTEKTKLSWNYIMKEYPLLYKKIISNVIDSRLDTLNKEIHNLSVIIAKANDEQKWFYKEVLAIKSDKLKQIELLRPLFL